MVSGQVQELSTLFMVMQLTFLASSHFAVMTCTHQWIKPRAKYSDVRIHTTGNYA